MSNTYKHKLLGKYNRNEISWEELGQYNFYGSCPKWHNKFFHIRPFRARTKHLLTLVKKGEYDISFPLTHKKPHKYYW